MDHDFWGFFLELEFKFKWTFSACGLLELHCLISSTTSASISGSWASLITSAKFPSLMCLYTMVGFSRRFHTQNFSHFSFQSFLPTTFYLENNSKTFLWLMRFFVVYLVVPLITRRWRWQSFPRLPLLSPKQLFLKKFFDLLRFHLEIVCVNTSASPSLSSPINCVQFCDHSMLIWLVTRQLNTAHFKENILGRHKSCFGKSCFFLSLSLINTRQMLW